MWNFRFWAQRYNLDDIRGYENQELLNINEDAGIGEEIQLLEENKQKLSTHPKHT